MTTTISLDRGRSFAQIVYQVLVVEKVVSLEQAAGALGMGYDALYARIIGRTLFTADEIAALIACVPDPRLIGYLLRHSNFVAVERVDGRLDDAEQGIIRATHRILIEAACVLETVDAALQDKRIEHREAIESQVEIDIAERASSAGRAL
ncbi:phage regulatory CII family protein [Aquibium microcysteis]|uniref:phage regulatory CII family protein n=1 Tax=Aquibium microcysteis TaxID=675281 RepID=UPI00165D2621|nr:phage regulatory CII family protein [Aquibium microcysteis]